MSHFASVYPLSIAYVWKKVRHDWNLPWRSFEALKMGPCLLQVYVPQNIRKIYFLHKISKTRFWWKLFVLLYTPSWHNFFLQCLKYIRQKDSLLFIVKVFNFFLYVPQNIQWHFNHIFRMVTPRALGQFFLFIPLNCLTSPVFIANLCSQLIPEHYKTGTTCTSKRTF